MIDIHEISTGCGKWRPLLNAYRTFCCAPSLEDRIILDEIGRAYPRKDPA